MPGRKKLSGAAACVTHGDGWQHGEIRGPWEFGEKSGPDIVLNVSPDVIAGTVFEGRVTLTSTTTQRLPVNEPSDVPQ